MSQYRFADVFSLHNLNELKACIAEQDGVAIQDVRAKQDPHPNADGVVLATTDEIDHWPDYTISSFSHLVDDQRRTERALMIYDYARLVAVITAGARNRGFDTPAFRGRRGDPARTIANRPGMTTVTVDYARPADKVAADIVAGIVVFHAQRVAPDPDAVAALDRFAADAAAQHVHQPRPKIGRGVSRGATLQPSPTKQPDR